MVGVNIGLPCRRIPTCPSAASRFAPGHEQVQGADGIGFFTQNKIASIRFTHPKGATAEAAADSSKVRSCVAS